MAIKTRKQGREALGALLDSELAGAGKPVQVVYPYLVEDFQAQSPTMAVASAGMRGEPFTFAALRPQFAYNVLTFVTRTSGGNGIEQAAENTLDEVAQALFVVVSANKKTADWECLQYDEGMSQLVAWTSETGGKYWLEITRFMMQGY